MDEMKRVSPLSASSAHADMATATADFFSSAEIVDAVLLVGSWALGHADEASDLDIAVLVTPEADEAKQQELVAAWEQSKARAEAAKVLRPIVRYSDVEIDLIDGDFGPTPRGWTSGPDDFELQIGNYVAHSRALFERNERYGALRGRWLPFYDDELRVTRLESVRTYCLNNLDHVPWSLDRGDHFHAFHRLYHAFQEFLQALFISRSTYPLAYDKWIGEQLDEFLGLPELAQRAAGIVGVAELDHTALAASATELRRVFENYIE
jgi:predicted nucleotidyltransferase